MQKVSSSPEPAGGPLSGADPRPHRPAFSCPGHGAWAPGVKIPPDWEEQLRRCHMHFSWCLQIIWAPPMWLIPTFCCSPFCTTQLGPSQAALPRPHRDPSCISPNIKQIVRLYLLAPGRASLPQESVLTCSTDLTHRSPYSRH